MDRGIDQDRHRPRYHYLPAANWMNDPNGLIFYKGHYHLFYQYNPNGAFWGTMHWGHAMSRDLVNWQHMPIALAPDLDGPDRDGCYSGAAVIHDGVPTLVYTGVRDRTQLPCLATSPDEDLATWHIHDANPVLSGTPEGLKTTIFRDHTLWREDDHWLMGVGSGIEGRGGAVLLYRSSDLKTWEYLHPLVVEDPTLNPESVIISKGWECPDFYFLRGQPLLIACDWDGDPLSVSYWTGVYDSERFIPTAKGDVDAGSPFYAPQSFLDATGRRVMFGWLMEARDVDTQKAAGWSGVMSLPRIVTMRENGHPAFSVAPEIEMLRGRTREVVPHDGNVDPRDIPGDSIEICAMFNMGEQDEVGIDVRCAPDDSERTSIRWNPTAGTLTLDTCSSSLDPETIGERAQTALTLDPGEMLAMRVFIDRSVIEVYVNDRVAISGRIYPTRMDSLLIRLTGAPEGSVQLYEMQAADIR